MMWWLLGACVPHAPVDPSAPTLPPPDPTFHLGVVGAPRDWFGDALAPTWADGFQRLVDAGFDRYLPLFLLDESGLSSDHAAWFLQPELLPGLDTTCAGQHGPYGEVPDGLKIVYPAYLSVADAPPDQPLDPAFARDRLTAFVDQCLGGDRSALGEAYLYDEPANNAIATGLDLGNVAVLADAAREVLEVDTLVVEAPVPLFFELVGATQAQLDAIVGPFWDAVPIAAASADHYGFDVYLVDLTDDFGGIGAYLDHARTYAPHARPISVIQGFGFGDMGMDLGTGRPPTREETRAVAFLSLIHGATSVWWYGQSAVSSDADVWVDLVEASADLRRLSGLVPLAPADVAVDGPIDVLARTDGTVTWVVLANPRGATEVTLTWPAEATVWDGLDRTRITDGATTLTLQLDAHDTRVLAIR